MICSVRRILATVSLLVVASSFFAAQTPPTKQIPPRPIGLARWSPTPQELFVPYWTLEPGWNTELEMRNNLAQRDLSITPVLRTTDGTEVPLQPVDLKPDEIVSINLRDATASAKPELPIKTGTFGSVVFRFNGMTASNAFAAAVVRREGHPIDFHFDAYDSGATAVEGIWSLPTESATDYLILSNPTSKPVTANLTLSNASGAAVPLTVTLAPGQSQRTNIREIFRAVAGDAVGGLSLSVQKDGTLSASEIVFDESTGFSAIMKLFDREPTDKPENHVIRAPMMALSQPDQSLGLPDGTVLEPKIFLRNAGSVSTVVSPGVNWRNEDDAGSSALPGITLSPGEIRTINLADFQKAGPIPTHASWGAVTLAYTGRRADLIAVAMSYDKTRRYGLQTPFIEGTNRLFKGSMWHADGTHNTLITTGNGGREKTRAQATLYYNGGEDKYRVEKSLLPGQQLWLDVGQITRNQIPDSDGKTIPPGVMTGSYELRDLDHPLAGLLYEGKLVVDKTYGHASYGCAACCGWETPLFDPYTFGGPPDIDFPEEVNSMDVCSLEDYDITDDMSDWKSSNTAVATLPSPTLHTVAVGTATGSAEVELQSFNIRQNCPYVQEGPAQPVCVGSLVFSGTANDFIFVGSNANIVSANTFFLALGDGTATGGKYAGSSSDSNDVVTLTWDSSVNLEKATVQTTDQSTKVGDRTLTFTYTPPGCTAALTLTQNVTARQFAWVTNNSPANTCSLGYGYLYNYTYTTYTHPDGAAVPSGVGLTNTPVTETFNPPTIACGNQPGNGSLDANSLFSDTIEVCGTSPIPACSSTNSQAISIAGYPVRTNSLTITNTELTYTSQGPTQ